MAGECHTRLADSAVYRLDAFCYVLQGGCTKYTSADDASMADYVSGGGLPCGILRIEACE